MLIFNSLVLGGLKTGPVTYVPPSITEKENENFESIVKGINFDKYDDIKVECTGNNVPLCEITR